MDKPFAILEQWVREGRIHLSGEVSEVAEDESLDSADRPLHCDSAAERRLLFIFFGDPEDRALLARFVLRRG